MWTDGIEAYSAVEEGGSTEVVDECGSKVVCRVVDPILFTVRVDTTPFLVKLGVPGSQFPVELPLSPLTGTTLFQRRRVGVGRVVDGLRVNIGFLMAWCGFVSSSRRL